VCLVIITRARKSLGLQDDLFGPVPAAPHWSISYARMLTARHPPRHRILIQTSMSPSGPFHVGNLRDTACAVLVHRAILSLGRSSSVLLSFDDYDPVRTGPAQGFPLADVGTSASSACVDYTCALIALGWAPPDLVESSANQSISGDGDWRIHYQAARYRSGTYRLLQRRFQRKASKLARLLKVSQAEALFAVYCENCGLNKTDILSLTSSRVRYACRSCGGMWTTRDLSVVKPSWALDWALRVAYEGIDCEPAGADHTSAGSTMDRTVPIYQRFLRLPRPVIVPYGVVRGLDGAKFSGSRKVGLTPADLLSVLTGPMVLWWFARAAPSSDLRIGLTFSAMSRWYDEYDRFLMRLGTPSTSDRDASLATLVDADLLEIDLPGWRRIVGLLHARCYDVEAAMAALWPREQFGASADVLRARLRRALLWIARFGLDQSWLMKHRAAGPVTAAETGELLRGNQLTDGWDRTRYELAYRALFGTHSGPPLRVLIKQFGEETIVDALRSPDPPALRRSVLTLLKDSAVAPPGRLGPIRSWGGAACTSS
jgi:lysyl-tRNA synthetase, class I